MKSLSKNKLRDNIERYLPDIDQALAQADVRVTQRIFLAAHFIVSVIDVKGDTKDDFLNKPWFKLFYQVVAGWYRKRYGCAATRRPDDVAPGVVLLHSTPFELRIPLVTTRVETPGETMWIVYPNTVLPEEDVHEWFVSSPNLRGLSPNELKDLDTRIIRVGESIRSIRINLLSADYDADDASLRSLSASINSHVDESARKIFSLNEADLSLAFWDMHSAIEKSLKVFLRQQGISPPKIHVLERLYELARSRVNFSLEHRLLDLLPPADEVISLRYGEFSKSVQDAMVVYNTMLDIVLACTGSLKRNLYAHNAAFLFTIPPWRRE